MREGKEPDEKQVPFPAGRKDNGLCPEKMGDDDLILSHSPKGEGTKEIFFETTGKESLGQGGEALEARDLSL